MNVSKQIFIHFSRYPCSCQQLYDWHSRAGALERLLPPWEKTEIIRKSDGIDPGAEVELKMRMGPWGILSIPFEARHVLAEPGRLFEDTQQRGPFAQWTHRHIFHEKDGGCQLEDRVEYALPLQKVLPAFVGRHVEKNLQRMFRYRVDTLRCDIELHERCRQKPLRLLVSGASGVLGRDLLPLLTTGGHEVWRLVRRRADTQNREIFWDPQHGLLDLQEAPRFDGVIHLAGEYIGLHRWTKQKKENVVKSRLDGTKLLVNEISSLPQKPRVFLCASATGFYGDSRVENLTEDYPAGKGFISEVCRLWEREAQQAEKAGIRTVMLRFGVGLTPKGGALRRILDASPLGYIRRFGGGEQSISWISGEDMAAAVLHCLSHNIAGPINIVAPEPVSNKNFMAQLSKITGKPLLFCVSERLLNMVYKEMAAEMLLASTHVSCKKLEESGFHFRHPNLETALRSMLGIY
ncbi:MAG: TIGR01777 family protein [Deltaproteobacteria bacterium]|nr:MAG: TIGR01777 family protein [Deltaproteobacteria bacterium]